jgi:hypothetical protein
VKGRVWQPALLLLCAAAFLARALPPGANSNAIQFEDAAARAGIRARMRCGGPEKNWIVEANGSGVAWLDFDRDGLMDLLIVNGSTIGDLRRIVAGSIPEARPGSVYLYRNLGGGKFEDVTARAQLSNPYWGTGVAVADFDNDGYPDILITNIGRDLLFRNNHDGTFREISAAAGLSRVIAWHTGGAFGDYDGDGKLDIYVAGYIDLHELNFNQPAPVCNYRGLKGFCGPKGMKGEADILYHNEGGGKFTDATAKAGLEDVQRRHGFTVVFDDFNGDGLIDIFVANDSDPNYLYLNQGGGKFKEAGLASGVAFNADGQTQSNMGVAVGTLGANGNLSVLTTTFSEDYFPLFQRSGGGEFEDVSAQAGLRGMTTPWLGWACGFADFDDDGNKDLWMTNGHVYPNADALASTSYFQPVTVLANRGGRFAPVPAVPSTTPANSYRGGAAGDFNNDGKIDLVVLPIAGAPVLLENRTPRKAHWIGLDLRGKTGNRDAIGAQIRLEACGRTQTDSQRNGGSYLSVNDRRIHFGLGECRTVDRIRIVWPGGRHQSVEKPAIDRYSVIEEQ